MPVDTVDKDTLLSGMQFEQQSRELRSKIFQDLKQAFNAHRVARTRDQKAAARTRMFDRVTFSAGLVLQHRRMDLNDPETRRVAVLMGAAGQLMLGTKNPRTFDRIFEKEWKLHWS